MGSPAARPVLLSAPGVINGALEPQFVATMADGNPVSRVTLVHTGSATHSMDVEQRFQDLSFVQSGQTLVINTPTNPNYTVAGYYMLFVFNPQGVPSEAKIMKIRYAAARSSRLRSAQGRLLFGRRLPGCTQGNSGCCKSPAVSGSPQAMFMFWMA